MAERNGITDLHIPEERGYIPLISPYQLKIDIPISDIATETVIRGRQSIENILNGKDTRKFIIMGSCSAHDPKASEDYANRANELSKKVSEVFVIVDRKYVQKPRTSLGWEGLITDPDLNGLNDMNKGLHLSREILLYNAEIGLPSATEYLDTFTPQYISDMVSWAAIGARTSYSPQHRQMASGLSMPVGIKNDTHGDLSVAVNGVLSVREPHTFLGINEYGAPSVVNTLGNPYAHIVLRGGTRPNYDKESVKIAQEMLTDKKLRQNVVIDCSHDNSGQDYTKQPIVFEDVVRQIVDGNKGIVGIMLESYLNAGSQKIPTNLKDFDRSTLKYGVSITDGCMDWETTKLIIMDAYKTLSHTIFPVSR